MWNKKKVYKLALVITGYFFLAFVISLFLFCVLYFTSHSVAFTYFSKNGVVVSEVYAPLLDSWIASLCVIASTVVFLVLFLFFLGQRLSYLMTIIQGVHSLHENKMNAVIPLEGNDELTELASTINFLAASQREIASKELRLKEEKEALIRSLSHDIRTPLTTILSYSEFLKDKDALTPEESKAYMTMIEEKAKLIKNLTDQLLGAPSANLEKIGHVKVLLEQLAFEWVEVLEDRFVCRVDLSNCHDFSGYLDVFSLRRIFDNLISNVEKYGEEASSVELLISCQTGTINIVQKNVIAERFSNNIESHKIGLENMKKIAADYRGELSVSDESGEFVTAITLNIQEVL